MPLGNRAEDYGVELAALEQKRLLASQEEYDAFKRGVDADWLRTFHKRFYRVRNAMSEADPAAWNRLTGPYPGIADFLRRRAGDVVLAISNSGETPELLAAARVLRDNGATLIAVTGVAASALAHMAEVVLVGAVVHEGGPLDLAPRASVLVQAGVLAALSAELQARAGVTREQYARWHPGGALGDRARDGWKCGSGPREASGARGRSGPRA